MQNFLLQDQKEKLNVSGACEYINHVSGLLRSKDHVVIHLQDMEESEKDDDPEARNIIPEITVDPEDIRIMKRFSNGFWKTDLEQQLLNHNVGLVVVAGFSAEECVTFTTNGAVERGFKAVILQKGILSKKAEAINTVYQDRPIISYQVIEFLIDSTATIATTP